METGGFAYMKTAPRCPVHGAMKLRGTPWDGLFACPGWDGEGCEHFTAASDVPWVHIGESGGIRFASSPVR